MRIPTTTLLVTFLTCGSCTPDDAPAPISVERTSLPVPDALVTVEGGVRDTILLRPSEMLEARDGLIALFDYGRMAVEAFDTTGTLLWVRGKRGDGPTEFRDPSGLTIDDDGSVWVQDRVHRAAVEIESNGRMRAPVPLPPPGADDRPSEIVATSSYLVLLTSMEQELTVWDPTTGSLRRYASPWTRLNEHHWMGRQSMIRRGPENTLVNVFVMGGGFRSFTPGTTFDELHAFIEPIPIPGSSVTSADGGRVRITSVEASYRAAIDAAVGDDILYVLFEGSTPDRRRLVDQYELHGGSYLGSWILPERASAIAVDGGRFISIEGDLIPKLVIRRIPGAGSR